MKKLAKGFTLIELMIVVAIIGILAAIAIPNFIKYQLRSKFSEASSNIEGLRKAEEALRQGERRIVFNTTLEPAYASGQYWDLTKAQLPVGPPGTSKMIWTTTELGIASAVDWQIEGATYFQYQVSTAGCAGTPSLGNAGVCYTVGARANIDGDSANGEVALAKQALNSAVATNPGLSTFPGVAADGSACYDSTGTKVLYGTPCTVTGPDVF
jgi:type IV pilus assembly protein PilA